MLIKRRLILSALVIGLCALVFVSCEKGFSLYPKNSAQASTFKIKDENLVHTVAIPENNTKPISEKDLAIYLMNKYASGYHHIYKVDIEKRNSSYHYKLNPISNHYLFTNLIFNEKSHSADLIVNLKKITRTTYDFSIESFDLNNKVLVQSGTISKLGKITTNQNKSKTIEPKAILNQN